MKKTILLLVVFMISNIAAAQNSTIAKFKYEEAEQAFVNNDYKQAISKLDEAETLLGSTNPKILYLKIIAQFKLIEEKPYDDFKILESAKRLSANYLKAYVQLSDNEDKYREIYVISEKLKAFPDSSLEFEIQKKQQKIIDEEKRLVELQKTKALDEAFMSYVYFPGYKVGLTIEETSKTYPNFKKYSIGYSTETNGDVMSPRKALGPTEAGLRYFYIKNNKTYGYYGMISKGYDDASYSTGKLKKAEVLRNLTNIYSFNPIEKSYGEKAKGVWSSKETSYVWNKNNKRVLVQYYEQSTGGYQYAHELTITVFYENIK
ncbi:hypothetical protein ACS386_11480 [Flavobacteriaceae bacterium LMO-SS05]